VCVISHAAIVATDIAHSKRLFMYLICEWIWENGPCTHKIEIHFIAYYNSHTQALFRYNELLITRSAFTDGKTDPVGPLKGINWGASLSEPHINVVYVNFLCLSIYLSVCLTVQTIIYKCNSNLQNTIDC